MSGTAVASSTALHNGDKLIKKHTLSGNRLRSHTVTAAQIHGHTVTAAQLSPPVWHALTLENGWVAYDTVNYGTPAYTIDDQGFVHFRGAIKGDSAHSGTFATLPAGFRPAESRDWLPVASNTGKSDPQTAALIVENTGDVLAIAGAGANLDFVSLAGVAFPAG